MGRPGAPARWLALAGGVAIALALCLPGAASGYLAGASAALPPPDTCVAPLLPCYIVLSIDSGSRGNHETVTGARFWPGEPFTVYFGSGTAGAAAEVVATGSTGTGSFTVSFDVPREPVGNYTVFVTDLAGDNQSASFHVTQLHARPDSGSVGTTTTLGGQGFLPDHNVTFRFNGVLASATGSCRTNRHGNFSGCVVKVPHVRAGTPRLTATDGTFIARIEFVVV
jgi:hypothetical protein